MEMSFEESLAELEKIVKKLEDNQFWPSLDESIMLFERGVKLVKECNTKLTEASQKVEKLIEENEKIVSEQELKNRTDWSKN